MSTSPFAFLQIEWPAVYDSAAKAATVVHTDPRTACFYARRALEMAVAWVYKHDETLRLPYQDNLSALIHEPSFKRAAGEALFNKAKVITQLGNQAVHSPRPIVAQDALMAVKELFHFGYWLAHTYARGARPSPSLVFKSEDLPKTAPIPKQTIDQLQALEKSLRERDEKLSDLLATNANLDAELVRLRAEVAAAKKAATTQPDTHDYSEAETRDYFIDLLLKEAGWALDQERDTEFEVSGMPNSVGKGYVDYVLWGNDGKPLGLIEAKRTRRDSREGKQQAKLYADCLEKMFGQRPVIFYSNGYEHWIWDDVENIPRRIQGFYKKDELELVLLRRTIRKPFAENEINREIAGRYYQIRAIRRIVESFEQDKQRKALIVMATGAGKTRTIIALCDFLNRCNWVKRVLFLADRVALVDQAAKEFKKHLPDSSPVNLVTEKDVDGRVCVSTYPTMMTLIDSMQNGERRFGVGHFDLVIIDEAHRSVFQKYRAIFNYFDSLLVGLTATPKEDVDRNTYVLFDIEDGVPTDSYSLDEAVNEKYLVPLKAVSVPLKFQRDGIRYEDLSESEREQWDDLEWDEDGEIPDRVESAAINRWLFNQDTVDKVLAHIMERGLHVAGGDRLGKTILFAKNQAHAEFICERFDANYPHFKGEFARVITFKTEYAKGLIEDFKIKDKNPHLAISVDMLDTGLDVPEVVNLAFFKPVRSKTKFWQMVGRGTRLCPDLFGPGKNKEFFYLFDYCQNLEYFSQNPETIEGSSGHSLGKRLFLTRLETIQAIDKQVETFSNKPPVRYAFGSEDDPQTELELRRDLAATLHKEVSAMNVDNFVIRPHRQWVEKYAKSDSWLNLPGTAIEEIIHNVAGLPTELDAENEEAKRFDLLILHLQLCLLQSDPGFSRHQEKLKIIAGLLEDKSAIPMVQNQIKLILDLQSDEWWQNVNTPMLESVRRRLRSLMVLIEKQRRKIIYSDFEDEMGPETQVHLPDFEASQGREKFLAKTRNFLREHQNHIAIHKLRMNKALTQADLSELEIMLVKSGVGDPEMLRLAATESNGLGLFVRSLVGMDREAAKAALGDFLSDKNLSANQIEFVNLIVNHLTENGIMDASLLYETPFTDIAAQGPDSLFSPSEMERLIESLNKVKASAQAA